jgi:hypothetical protein
MAERIDEPDKGMAQASSQPPALRLGGCSALGLLVTGVAGFVVAAYECWKDYMSLNRTDSTGMALALVASALAFGFLCNAIYRR